MMQAGPLPTYRFDDVHRLVRRQPLMAVASSASAVRRLRRELSQLEAWGRFLPHWRTLRCEPLDFAYGYISILGCYDAELRDDLLFRFGGTQLPAIGAWIAALSARPSDAPALRAVIQSRPERPWIYEFALGVIEGDAPPEMASAAALMAQLRERLSPIEKPRLRLRLTPSVPSEVIETLRVHVAELYRREGATAALAYIEQQVLDGGERLTAFIRPQPLYERDTSPRCEWLWTVG